MIKEYKTATAFRSALETRLKNIANAENIDIQKLRRQVAFDRLLSRLFRSCPDQLFLKGGYSMELRIQKARATKDIDLILKTGGTQNTDKDDIHEKLIKAAKTEKNDFFEFFIHQQTLDLEAVPYGGLRFPVEASLDGRLFVRFPIDVVISSLVLDPIEKLDHRDWLGFAGIESKPYPTISREQQFAEKLHAYTYPRDEEENSRVKDVIDMFLLVESGEIDQEFLKQAIKEVFEYRGTHEMPNEIQDPPENWGARFQKLASECGVGDSLVKTLRVLKKFYKELSL